MKNKILLWVARVCESAAGFTVALVIVRWLH